MTRFPVRRWPVALAALALIVMIPVTAAVAAGPAEAPRVTAEDVKERAAKGEVVIVDVRGKADYDMEHAEGAVSIPLDQLEKRMSELPKNKLIAAYCT